MKKKMKVTNLHQHQGITGIVMIAYPVYEQQPHDVSAFLKNKPQVIGVLQLLVALGMLGFIIWTDYLFFLVSPLFYILTGSIVIVAAHKRNLCLVRTSHALCYINMVAVAISIRFHLAFTLILGVLWIVLVIGDALVLIFSIIIASSSCMCCCRPQAQSVAVSYMSTALPVTNIVLPHQSDAAASPQPVTSVMYVLPAGQVPSAPPPYYSLVPTVPTAPPPAYEQASAFSPPELRTQGQDDQIHQHVK